MDTLRGRLTALYATALALTLGLFAVILYISVRRSTYIELDRRIESEADLTAGILSGVYHAGGLVVQGEGQRGGGGLSLANELSASLAAVPDYLIITSARDSVLFLSADAREHTFAEVNQLLTIVTAAGGERREGTVAIQPSGPRLRYIVRRITDAGPDIGAVLAGAPSESVEVSLDRLLQTFVVVLPLGILLAWVVGSWIATRAVAPVNRIIDEAREITDGQSLHRRLPVPFGRDEMARLAETLNQMMSRLERSFAALRRFTAEASHELKTPLTVLRAGVERAITTAGLPLEALPPLEESLSEISRMTELVDALLTLARADEGEVPLHREPVDLKALVDDAKETGELLAEQAGVSMKAETPAEPVVIAVDGTRIRQLLLNLLTNAVKYTPPGGRVRLWMERENGRVKLGVSDTGIGIAPGDLPHIFDRFWRADSARTRTGERPGVGLGLAICKWIAEAHGGSIEVQSRPGRGTTFTVTLPATAPGAAPSPHPAAS
ncbi:MAG TPA: ATP-binding protein [Gemmatimonadales bacterium]|nr:ATP-binding protein [Gemmatimonadales bacterium]